MGTKCMCVFKTKVDKGKAKEISTKIVEKVASTAEAGGRLLRTHNQRSLDGVTSVSASATQEEVIEGDEQSTEDYSESGTSAETEDGDKTEDDDKTTATTPSAADGEEGEEDYSSLSHGSTTTIATATVAVFAAIMGLML